MSNKHLIKKKEKMQGTGKNIHTLKIVFPKRFKRIVKNRK